MTATLTPLAATQAVIWGGLVIGLVLGAAAQASRFCTMGALTDWFSYGGTARLTMWMLAVAVAALGSMTLVSLGVFDAARTLAWSDRLLWLSYLVGGGLFGIGMVLASGCPQRNLVRAGAGSLKAIVTLLVAAVAAQMTLRGLFAGPRVNGLDAQAVALGRPQDIGSVFGPLVGVDPATLRWTVLVLALVGVAFVLWRTRAAMERIHWIGGLVVGLLVPAAWWLTGNVGFLAEHPDTLEAAWLGTASRRPEALTFAAPLAHGMDLLTLWSDKNTVLTFGVVVSLGVVLGSTVAALLRREFRFEGFHDAEDVGSHLIGGVLMGFGGVTAMGCSIGQGLSGMAMLSAGACLALAGMVGGTWAALRVQTWRLERAAG